jgi:hypothetical protein
MQDKRNLGRLNKIVGSDFEVEELLKIHEEALINTTPLFNNHEAIPFSLHYK